jgi:HAD superfamily hydrolase (TIGR01457 family)
MATPSTASGSPGASPSPEAVPGGSREDILADRYDSFLLDLDGVLYRGDQPVEGAGEAVERLRARQKGLAFVTNNSSRTPAQVAEKLTSVGVPAGPEEVVSSATATAHLLAEQGGGSAFVIGEAGIREALSDAGLRILDGEPERVDHVVIGWDRSADYTRLRTAALLVQAGASLVATNADPSYPAPNGLWPGAGALLAAVTTTLGRPADIVVGKPNPGLYRAALERAGAGRPLVVGDRVDTDIAGAAALGWDSLLVLTGVVRPADLLHTFVLPTFLARDLGGLDRPAADVGPASEGDAGQVEGLLRASGLEVDDVGERLSETLVARSGGAVVGTAAVELFDDLAHLRSVAVHRGYRGAHLGTILTARAVALARERGARTLYAVTETAERFFVGLGFEAIGTKAALPAPIASTPMVAGHCSESSIALRFSLD